MGHDHQHSEDRSTYYIEQLCTIGICGAFGGIAIMMYARKTLWLFLDPKFHPFLLAAGIALLVMVAVRAVVVWRSAGQGSAAHDHGHDHGHAGAGHDHAESCAHDHDHDHAHDHGHEHSHEHGHEHAWNPWRYAVLLLPIVLYFLNLPNKGFSSDWLKSRALNPDQLQTTNVHYCSELGIQLKAESTGALPQVEKVSDDSPAAVKGKGKEEWKIRPGDVIVQITREHDNDGRPFPKPETISTEGMSLDAVLQKLQGPADTKVKLTIQRAETDKPIDVELIREEKVIDLEFKELERAALTAVQRDYYAGRKGRVKGQFSPSKKDKCFTLMRLKMTCCAADVIPLQVWIEAPDKLDSFKSAQWVEVEGQIRFDQAPGKFIPVLKLVSMDKIRPIPPEPDLYVR